MATKKQHYVPQFHLRKFSADKNHVFVLEKSKAKFWKSSILDAAEEIYFYKLNISDTIKSSLKKEQFEALNDACIKDLGKPLSELSTKEIEKMDFVVEEYFANCIEPRLIFLMDKIISNTFSGNRLLMYECFFLKEEEKQELSWLFAKQFIRTKHHRDQKINMLTEFKKKEIPIIAQFCGIHIDEKNINVSYSKEEEKLIHANEIFDDKTAGSIAGVFNNHIWILLENFTEEPFCCSDNLFSLIPTHKLPAFYGYGLATYGMTIWCPISSKLMLVMIEKNKFGNFISFTDRKIVPIYKKEYIENVNYDLIAMSYKYVFFSDEETVIKYKEMCADDKILRTPASLGNVG